LFISEYNIHHFLKLGNRTLQEELNRVFGGHDQGGIGKIWNGRKLKEEVLREYIGRSDESLYFLD